MSDQRDSGRRRHQFSSSSKSAPSVAPLAAPSPAPSMVKRSLRQFSLAEITKATKNFDQALVIRRSVGSGDVYKGIIYDYVGTKKLEKTVAIRCFFLPSWQPTLKWVEYQIEVSSQYCHKHVVSVIGYCHESGRMMAVYEFMPNGSLANHLRTKSTPSSFSLSWEQCLDICIGAARGLEYMHTIKYLDDGSFVHCDVTATNILLDENGVAKISDVYSETFVRKHMASYFDPQYRSGHLRRSSAVFAFGVLLVKVLSRKVSFDEEDKNLGERFRQDIVNGTLDQIIHPDMKAQISPDRLKAIVRVAGECLQTNFEDRPTMIQVVKDLEFAIAASSSQGICRRYSFNEVEDATKNFENILGEGGEGKVYKGMIKANITVAVKRLKPEHSSEIERETEMLSKLDHPNLVSLLGYCDESDEKILIYDYMRNGSLQNALRASSLSWEQLLNICVGVARGLRYLHTSTKDSPKGIIHRDMKPGNILLDENFVAKISDFGLSKMSNRDQANSEIATMLKGTTGYLAPEYNRNQTITRKIDVYAFGVILSEVLCRKKPWDGEESFYFTEDEKYSLWVKKNVVPNLKGAISPECLEGITDILEKCLNSNPKKRPSMNDVVSVLENAQKWQEAWQKNDSGGLFYLPGGEDRVVVYYTSIPEDNSRTFQDCLKVRLLLRRFGVPIDERDPTKDLYSKEFKHVFGNTSMRLPQVFIQGKYVGGVEILSRARHLAKVLGVSPPRFICQNCEEAMACDECTREQWYVLCKNCDALTIVSKNWGGESRSCLECNGNQLIYKSILETK